MFTIVLTILCAVFVIGYIFFAAATPEQEDGAGQNTDTVFTRNQDAA